MTAKISGKAKRLRIFVGEHDRVKGVPLYHLLVRKAREMGLAGATVVRGFEGFGAHSRIKSANLLDLSTDLPIVVEIVDSAEYIERFLPTLDALVDEGLVTMDDVDILKYSHREKSP